MNFERFWTEVYKGDLAPAELAQAKAIAASAWSEAVCREQAACFDRGEMRPAGEICAALSLLHPWNEPTTETIS